MTNPIALGPAIAAPSGAGIAPGRTGAPDASGFVVLLEGAVNEARDTRSNILGTNAPAPVQSTQDIDLDTLSDALSELLARLTGLEQGIKKDHPLDTEALEAIAGLLQTVTGLLDTGAVIGPDSPLLGQLGEFAKSLGIDLPAQGTGPQSILETLSALATRVGSQLRETTPDLANALTGFARTLDTQIAAIETALANAEPDASIRLKLVESETRPNASAAIAAAEAEKPATTATTPEKSPAPAPGDSKRTLSAPEGETSAKPNASPSQPGAQAAAAAAAASTAETPTEAPDGLTIPAGQSQASIAAPGAMRPETAAYARPEPRINMPHIAVEIARSLQNGVSRFEIRLNPPELGRIDVRLEMDNAGNVTARLAVEKSETLDLLQRDQRALEKALADAGLDGGKTDLEFSLREDNAGEDQPDSREKWSAGLADTADNTDTTALPPPDGVVRGYARLDAVNLWV